MKSIICDKKRIDLSSSQERSKALKSCIDKYNDLKNPDFMEATFKPSSRELPSSNVKVEADPYADLPMNMFITKAG